MIDIVNRQRTTNIDTRSVEETATRVLSRLGRLVELPATPIVTVAFLRDRDIRKLNSRFRGKDQATDVLSFPAGDAGPGADPNLLGDIVISVDAAARQAETAGHGLAREIEELVIHGLLHLAGFDHEVDDGEMDRLEVRLRRMVLDAGKATREGENRKVRP